jgi:hypothetical protein
MNPEPSRCRPVIVFVFVLFVVVLGLVPLAKSREVFGRSLLRQKMEMPIFLTVGVKPRCLAADDRAQQQRWQKESK